MLGENAVRGNTVSIYRDAWGVRKLMSHVLRNLRSDRIPREAHFKLLYSFCGPDIVNVLEEVPTPYFQNPFSNKDPRARTVARVFIQAWFPDNLAEWDEQNFMLAQPVVPLESLPSEDCSDCSLFNMIEIQVVQLHWVQSQFAFCFLFWDLFM